MSDTETTEDYKARLQKEIEWMKELVEKDRKIIESYRSEIKIRKKYIRQCDSLLQDMEWELKILKERQ